MYSNADDRSPTPTPGPSTVTSEDPPEHLHDLVNHPVVGRCLRHMAADAGTVPDLGAVHEEFVRGRRRHQGGAAAAAWTAASRGRTSTSTSPTTCWPVRCSTATSWATCPSTARSSTSWPRPSSQAFARLSTPPRRHALPMPPPEPQRPGARRPRASSGAALCFGGTFIVVQDAIEVVEPDPLPHRALHDRRGAALASRGRTGRRVAALSRDGRLDRADASSPGSCCRPIGLQYTDSATSAFLTYLLVPFVPLLALRRLPAPPRTRSRSSP